MSHYAPEVCYAGATLGQDRKEWRPIPGHPGYEASDAGDVRSVDRVDSTGRRRSGRVLKQARTGRYACVRINGRTHRVHRLVLLAFEGPCPRGMEACHYNGNSLDNRIDNLRWGTHRSNMAEANEKARVMRNVALARRQRRTLEFAIETRALKFLGLSDAFIADCLRNEAGLTDEQVTRLLIAAARDEVV